MLKAIGWVLKAAIFSVVVLILGNWLHVGGKTISDQVKTQMSHAEHSGLGDAASSISNMGKGWAEKITGDAKKGAVRAPRTSQNSSQSTGTPVAQKENEIPSAAAEEIPSSERQKLRALIRDLNTAH